MTMRTAVRNALPPHLPGKFGNKISKNRFFFHENRNMKGEGHMFNWIARNLSTIIICLVLAAVVVLIIVSLVKDKRKGKSSCGCKCAHCPMAGSCHKK